MRFRWRNPFRRKPNPPGRFRPRKYVIRFNIGGKPYYMVWDAWERAEDGQWVILTQEQMANAVQIWIASDSYVTVGRSGANVAVFKTGAIEEFEVLDFSYFESDV
jgi:hypothetical protein